MYSAFINKHKKNDFDLIRFDLSLPHQMPYHFVIKFSDDDYKCSIHLMSISSLDNLLLENSLNEWTFVNLFTQICTKIKNGNEDALYKSSKIVSHIYRSNNTLTSTIGIR